MPLGVAVFPFGVGGPFVGVLLGVDVVELGLDDDGDWFVWIRVNGELLEVKRNVCFTFVRSIMFVAWVE